MSKHKECFQRFITVSQGGHNMVDNINATGLNLIWNTHACRIHFMHTARKPPGNVYPITHVVETRVKETLGFW